MRGLALVSSATVNFPEKKKKKGKGKKKRKHHRDHRFLRDQPFYDCRFRENYARVHGDHLDVVRGANVGAGRTNYAFRLKRTSGFTSSSIPRFLELFGKTRLIVYPDK